MKILHLANVGGEARGGGVHEVAYNFYLYQKELGIEPTLWFPGTDDERNFYKSDADIKVLRTFSHPDYGILKELLEKKEAMDFDILHQHGIWLPNSLLTRRYRKKGKGPTLIQPHGYLEPYRLTLSKYKKKLAYTLFEKRNLMDATMLVACSDQEAINLKLMFPQKEISIIANGIPKEFIDQAASLNQKTEKSDKLKMVFLSRIHPIKGLERFIRIIHKIGTSKFSNWSLEIAGFEEVNHEYYLKKLVKDLNLSDFVSFVGPRFGQDKIDFLSGSDVFVLPTFNENYGIVVAEALGRGIPVLTTKGTPWSELEKNNCGWWVENDENGIMEGLLKILNTDKITLSAMGERGKKLVMSKYTWEETTKSTLELYNYLLNKRDKPSFII